MIVTIYLHCMDCIDEENQRYQTISYIDLNQFYVIAKGIPKWTISIWFWFWFSGPVKNSAFLYV